MVEFRKTQLKYEESAAESVFVANLFIKDLYWNKTISNTIQIPCGWIYTYFSVIFSSFLQVYLNGTLYEENACYFGNVKFINFA